MGRKLSMIMGGVPSVRVVMAGFAQNVPMERNTGSNGVLPKRCPDGTVNVVYQQRIAG